MSASIGVQEGGLGGRRKMADLENCFEVLDWNGNGVGRIGYLAHEAAVLAHRVREPKAHARRPVVQHLLEYALVLRNGADFAGFVAVPPQSRAPPRPNPSIACLTWAKAEGLTESSRKPQDKSAGTQRGSPAISPHRLTLIPARLPYCAVRADELKHRRLERIDQFAERSVGPIARRDILSQIVGANGKECCPEPLDRQGCRRHFDHDAKFGKRCGNTFGLQLVNLIREYLACQPPIRPAPSPWET